jgi:endonuclease YncB( thermonuclease family)
MPKNRPDLIAWPEPDPATEPKAARRSGLFVPLCALLLAAVALWMTGALDGSTAESAEAAAPNAAVPEGTTTASGLRFGMCDEGGGTNCVIGGDSFYLHGKAVQIAGIEAPRTHSPGCQAEAQLGRLAATGLRAMLNSGPLTLVPAEQGFDSNGRLLRTIEVNGQDVGRAMIAKGFARRSGNGSGGRSWC